MANLASLEKRVKKATVDLGDGDVLNIEYRPAAYTPAFEQRARDGAEAHDSTVLGRMLAELLADWDLFEDDKQTKKVPITPERLGDLPLIVVVPILEVIGDAMNPKAKSEGPSGAGSMEP